MRYFRISLSVLLLAVAIAAALMAAYRYGFQAGEIEALKVPLRHNDSRTLVQGQLRILTADTREPADRCMVEFILIGPDGGDGGFQYSITNSRGIAKIPEYLGPGRYQIELSGRAGSRYIPTSYHTNDTYLLIRPDGSYSPYEYTVNVKLEDE